MSVVDVDESCQSAVSGHGLVSNLHPRCLHQPVEHGMALANAVLRSRRYAFFGTLFTKPAKIW